jgi:6-phosphogluconolactonase
MESATHIFPDNERLAQAFADWLCEWAAGKSGLAIALSGGSTPKRLFQLLAGPYLERLYWPAVHLYWGDERCVPPEHEESNYRMTRELLLSQAPIPESNVHRIRGEVGPALEARRYAEEMRRHLPLENGRPVFDLVLLGMGEDGHTASIFPDRMDLLVSPEDCAAAVHPQSGQARVTLTGPVINQAREVVFLVAGEGKADIAATILNRRPGWERYPAGHIQPLEGRLRWLLDRAAASRL